MHPEVYEAAKSGNSDKLERIIAGNGEDLFHQTTPKENNILHVAAQYKQLTVIKCLLRFPSGPSLLRQGNRKGDSPFHVAAKVGSCEAVQLFVDLVKSRNWLVENTCIELLRKQNLRKDTALHHAVNGGHDEVVKLLIEEDPELCNITNASDESPLYLAAHRRLSDTIKLILDASPLPPSHKGPYGLTALHAAVHFWLPSKYGTNFDKSSLFLVQGFSQDWWEILRENPEVIKEGDDMGWTPLHYAACFGDVKAVRLLLQHDNSVAYNLDKEGESALHIAAFRGHINVICELVASRPDAWDIMNIKGRTALHAAVIGGQERIVKYVLGIPNLEDLINEEDTDGNTALHLAVLHRRYGIVLMLAEDSRVNRFVTNKDHLTALDILFTHKEAHPQSPGVCRTLKGYHGFPVIQRWAEEYVKNWSGNQFFEGQPAGSVITGSNTPNQGNSDSSIGGIIDLNLLVAALIATATFAATFTMPGGYNSDGPNQGMATLAGKAAFHVFMVSNTVAFFFSTMALLTQYDTFTLRYHEKVRSTIKAAGFIYVAMLGMVLAFVSGAYVVLTRNIGLAIATCVVSGCLVYWYFASGGRNPESLLGMRYRDPDYYRENALRDYGILRRPLIMEDSEWAGLAMLRDGVRDTFILLRRLSHSST